MAQATQPPISLTALHYIDFTLTGLTMDDLVAAICAETGVESQPAIVGPQLHETSLGELASVATPSAHGLDDLLPSPFAMLPIPEGQVTLVTNKGWAINYIPEGNSKTFDVPAFEMGKYPVTNAQYAEFIKAGGYTHKQ